MPLTRKIIEIDEDKCNGCGNCIIACAEAALELIDGKARLVKDVYCDGLGACLGECPTGALKIIERPAEAFDEEAVEERIKELETQDIDTSKQKSEPEFCGCPGSRMMQFSTPATTNEEHCVTEAKSELTQWPVQLKLVPVNAPYFKEANLVLCADCVPFAVPNFHSKYLRGNAIAVGCPKLDDAQFYIKKLAEIFKHSGIKSLTVLHMQVPCCNGLVYIAQQAADLAKTELPITDITIGINGEVVREDCGVLG